jgi:ubiquinone/menaquinone biosynthesis C-methylase UbiE
MSDENQNGYESLDIVEQYAVRSDLMKPEETILEELRSRLGSLRMLDLGVGGGRTTAHFGALAREYLGVDYAANMVARCQGRFPDLAFTVMDVRRMPDLSDGGFDFILFSFNGLDYMGHQDRLLALGEIARVCARGGWFCFSSHNLLAVPRLFALRFSFNPFIFARRLGHHLRLRSLNRPFPVRRLTGQPFAVLNDGAHGYRFWTYYVRPQEQIRQLEAAGFDRIRLFSCSDGREAELHSEAELTREAMLYYLCMRA